jgi:hypothetical protein
VVPLGKDPTDYEVNTAGVERSPFVTANCFCRRDAFRAVGGFDERFRRAWREDSDLYFSLLERGGRVVREPGALVVHPVRPARWGVSLRQQQNALYEARLYKKHPQRYWTAPAARPWLYYGILGALALLLGGLLAERPGLALLGGAGWLLLTATLCWRRLRHSSRRPRHVAEMAVTSALIPPLACFWRIAGAIRERVFFF